MPGAEIADVVTLPDWGSTVWQGSSFRNSFLLTPAPSQNHHHSFPPFYPILLTAPVIDYQQ